MTLSLRARLLLGLVALVVVGIMVADVATYASLKTFLYQRVDTQLKSSDEDLVHALNSSYEPHGPGPEGGRSPQSVPAGTYAAVIGSNGSVVVDLVTTAYPGQTAASARPVLPKPSGSAQVVSTVAGRGGVSHYELLIEPLSQPPGDYLAVAIPLTDVDSTLAQLVQLELLIGVLVVLAAALLGLVLVRLGLQPLARMGATAAAIAGGDLSRRVEPATDRTEIGRLGLALNAMLTQIEAAIAGGDLSRRVEPATDRTEIGRLGLALNAMLTQIEAAFAERTESNQRLRRFLADASHELRTPLTSIRGYAEILRRGAERKPEDAALARRRIEEEAVRMTALVDDLLLLARLDQGRPLARETVDLQALVRDAQTDALAVAPNRPVQVVAPDRVVITGDNMRLRQVLGNLVRNALVHTPAATPIDLSLQQLDGKAVLKVADHGPGLPAGVGDRVFEPFFRADAGRSRDRGGAGLGLSIVAAVVAAHGGNVRVESTEGGGATFTVELPR